MSARIPEEYLKHLSKEDMKVLIELSKIHIPDDVIENAIKEAVKRNEEKKRNTGGQENDT